MIQLTRASEYALRGIQYLADKPVGTICMLAQISAVQDVPVSFLGKIFQSLTRANIVSSHRGAGGGFALSRPADSITLLEIIEAVEGPISLYDCLTDDTVCPEQRRSHCTIRPVLYEAIAALQDVFGRRTAADLVCGACGTESDPVQSLTN